MNWRSERGAGRLGCLITLLLAIVFGYASLKIIPVYVDRMDFSDEIASLASRAGAGGGSYSDEKIVSDVLQTGRYKGFEIRESDIKVQRSSRVAGGELRIEVKYSKTVEFPGYTYVFRFDSKASSVVGSLR